MAKKSVKYIREGYKTDKRKNKVKAKSKFCQFCIGGSMRKETKREKRVSALIDKMINSMSPDTLERIEKSSLMNEEEKGYRVFYSSGEKV